jgi:hypothetical protein
MSLETFPSVATQASLLQHEAEAFEPLAVTS